MAFRGNPLFQQTLQVSVTKGKKFQTFESVATETEAIMKQAMGPSGNLQAPTYRVGNDYVIGFNAELYEDWLT